MPQNLSSVHGLRSFVVSVGEKGRITIFQGEHYEPVEVQSPTVHDLRAVWVESPHRAWAVGEGGTILRWDGAQWWPQALGTRLPGPLNAIWGHPDDGIWLAGAKVIINHHPTYGSSLYESDADVRAIWGRHADDLWLVCADRLALWWNGERCERIPLPGDDDEQWNAVAGPARGDTFIVGPSGFMLRWDGRKWEELPTDTTAVLTGAVCVGAALYVTTDDGTVREYRRGAWRTVAFSAFGGGLNGICATIDGIVWAVGDRSVVLMHRPDGEE